jgi:pyrroloquinoline quinone biosynthesis protein B
VLVHLNNTNPLVRIGSPERAWVEAAGIVVGADAMEFEL